MSKTLVIVGTRKGCFILESDERRLEWELRGPFCEGWPIYHAVHDADTGAIYAAGASEWHGASIWRSLDLGETWTQSSEGLEYGDTGLKLSKVSGLTAAHGRLFAGAEMPGIFESRDGGQTWRLLSTLAGPARQRGVERSCQPAAGASRHPRDPPPPRGSGPLLGDRPGRRHLRDDRRRHRVDAAEPRIAGRLAAREPRGRLLRPQARDVADRHATGCTSRTTSACTGVTTRA